MLALVRISLPGSSPKKVNPLPPITPEMVGTTIVELAGVSSQQRAEFRVLEGGRVIHDLL